MTSTEIGQQIIFLQKQIEDFPENQELKKSYTAAINAWKEAYTIEINSEFELEKSKILANSEMMKGYYAYQKACIENRSIPFLPPPILNHIKSSTDFYMQQSGYQHSPPNYPQPPQSGYQHQYPNYPQSPQYGPQESHQYADGNN